MRDKKIKLQFYRKWAGTDPSGASLKVEDQLYECKAMFAPDHPDDGKFFPIFPPTTELLEFFSAPSPLSLQSNHNPLPDDSI